MGYTLHAFIGTRPDLAVLAENFHHASVLEVGKGIFLIPMTGELFEEINNFIVSGAIGKLTYMTLNVESNVLKIAGNNSIAYVEAEYFGGEGGQQAVLWQTGQRYKLFEFGEDVINDVLKHFGVKPEKGYDAFDTIGLGRKRNTEDWLTC